MHGGQIIARGLKAQGVNFLFTLCGGHISPILVGAREAGIRVIDCPKRHAGADQRFDRSYRLPERIDFHVTGVTNLCNFLQISPALLPACA